MIRRSLYVVALLPLLAMPAQAQVPPAAEVEVGTSLICDTQAQVERFVALYDGDAQSTVDTVNAAEHNPTACAVTTIAFVRGPQLATARGKETTFQIAPILVLGVVTEAGVTSVSPAPFYSVFEVEEIGV
jgi:Tfp pilus assembly protein PilE